MSEPKLTETLKKVFAVGVSGALFSEELIKNYLSDAKLPKDLLQALIHNAQKSKEDLTGKVSSEVLKMLSKVDWIDVGSKFLETHKLSIKIELDFEKKQPSSSQQTSQQTQGSQGVDGSLAPQRSPEPPQTSQSSGPQPSVPTRQRRDQ
jgi:SpoVK/Ycf46/Vps4 family AAA+-type ATPase